MSEFRTYQTATATGADLHHDTLLSNIAVRAFNASSGMAAQALFPLLPVGKQSDKYLIVDPSSWLRIENDIRAPKTRARRIEWKISSDTYFATNRALATERPMEDFSNADAVFALREDDTEFVVSMILRSQELRVSRIVTSISNVGSGAILAGASQWSDFVQSDPLGDVSSGSNFVYSRAGLWPNTIVMDRGTIEILSRHPDLLDFFKYTSGGPVPNDQIARAFKVQNLVMADGIMENALEGGVSSLSTIWGHVCILAHIGAVNNRRAVAPGVRLQWKPEGFPQPMQAMISRIDQAGSEHVEITEVQLFQDEKVVARDLIYSILNTH